MSLNIMSESHSFLSARFKGIPAAPVYTRRAQV